MYLKGNKYFYLINYNLDFILITIIMSKNKSAKMQ